MTAPQTTPLPDAPVRNSNASEFISKANTFLGALPDFGTEINTVSTFVNDKVIEAESLKDQASDSADNSAESASQSASSAVLSAASASATVYDPAATYNFPDAVVCTNGGTYRCMGTDISGIDPVTASSADWLPLMVTPVVAVHTADFSPALYIHNFVDTTTASITATLPASPHPGDLVMLIDLAGTFGAQNLTVARNGQNIMGLAEDMVVDVDWAKISMIFLNSTYGWRLI